MNQIKTKAVTEKKAHAETRLLEALHDSLREEGIACLVVRRVRLVLAYGKIQPVTHQPGELLVFGPDGSPRGRVTIQTGMRGTAYRVCPRGGAPECQFVMTQLTEVIAYLGGVVRDYGAAVTGEPSGG
ncbi:hypothetical protein DQ384_20460 [Sphaerisporangium album]|uniref:Uncharacterized protein n=1 Tax=Sphaerisporangium album TaxID=509200 RepID=A0A367FGA6_9ACTN|nr:hypothetical protein [Sphaerisporangium album]RCG29423.1 hypothetical protein DQ384_20460 [Sphaerisporangium album]